MNDAGCTRVRNAGNTQRRDDRLATGTGTGGEMVWLDGARGAGVRRARGHTKVGTWKTDKGQGRKRNKKQAEVESLNGARCRGYTARRPQKRGKKGEKEEGRERVANARVCVWVGAHKRSVISGRAGDDP